MNDTKKPRVGILMATYNGSQWIKEQIGSIFSCVDVEPHVFISDDGSSDDTLDVIKSFENPSISIINSQKSGGAGQNFISMLLYASWDECDFIAFSDQDDIWRPNKLIRAIKTLRKTGAHAYSSDVTAVWSDGCHRYIRKSQPQQKWDYHFESAGPGNTFVFPRETGILLRSHLLQCDPALLQRIALHDWMSYAVIRSHGKQWVIDHYSGVEYRQHAENVIGVAKGPAAIRARIELIRSDWYREQILAISEVTDHSNAIVDYLRSPRLRHIWVPLWHMRKCRRRGIEALIIAVIFVLMAFRRNK